MTQLPKSILFICLAFWLIVVVIFFSSSTSSSPSRTTPNNNNNNVNVLDNPRVEAVNGLDNSRVEDYSKQPPPGTPKSIYREEVKYTPENMQPFQLLDVDVTHYGFPAEFQGQPSSDKILTKLANQQDLSSAWCASGLRNLHMLPNIWHRKQWELSYIQTVLNTFGKLKPGMKGLVFAVGTEPLVSYFAKLGIFVSATDAPTDNGWTFGSQWGDSVKSLYKPWSNLTLEEFAKFVTFEPVDMNKIPEKFLQQQYDFMWTTCSVEHVGSIPLGQQFIMNSVKALKPGGVAIHTTEFNVKSLETTVDKGRTVVWRKKDIEELRNKLCNAGVRVFPTHFGLGFGHFDVHPDDPPYSVKGKADVGHIKMKVEGQTSTCVAVVLQVPETSESNPCEGPSTDVTVNATLPY